ncbi:SMP-30/gluconolactonase/LRE family protein [Planctomycetota bacterium]
MDRSPDMPYPDNYADYDIDECGDEIAVFCDSACTAGKHISLKVAVTLAEDLTEGRLVTCEHGARRVSRTEKDGSVVTLADSFQGRRLNSPNDVVVKSDGTVWFTDPPYGIGPEDIEQPTNYVFRLDPATNELTAVADDFDRPNGLCFSPDESKLYIADSSHEPGRSHVRVFDVTADNTLTGGEIFTPIDPESPDGMRFGPDGRLYVAAGDGIHIFDAAGTMVDKIEMPIRPSNLTFGGPDHKTLYITARPSLFSIRL